MSPRRIAKTLAGIGIAALTIIVVAAVWIIKSRERERNVLSHTVRVEPGSLLHAQNFHWTQMKGDKEQWQLVATEASYGEDRILADAQGHQADDGSGRRQAALGAGAIGWI